MAGSVKDWVGKRAMVVAWGMTDPLARKRADGNETGKCSMVDFSTLARLAAFAGKVAFGTFAEVVSITVAERAACADGIGEVGRKLVAPVSLDFPSAFAET